MYSVKFRFYIGWKIYYLLFSPFYPLPFFLLPLLTSLLLI